jgi:hypothetical protein
MQRRQKAVQTAIKTQQRMKRINLVRLVFHHLYLTLLLCLTYYAYHTSNALIAFAINLATLGEIITSHWGNKRAGL